MKKIILKIDGMSCSACSNGLEKYLNKQEDVEATVNLVMATASISYNEKKYTINDLEEFVKKAGFKSLGEEKLDKKEKKVSITPYILLGLYALFIMYVSMSHMINLPTIEILNMVKHPKIYAVTLLILTIPFLFYGYDILKSGVKNLIHKMPNMDTLVSIGVISSFIYSIYSVIMIILNNNSYVHNLYFESVVFVIYFVKLGRFIDTKNKKKTLDAVKELVTITPEKAKLKDNDGYKEVTIDLVKKGDILVCLPGERIAVDGIITKGSSHFDESFITGESNPVEKKKSSLVVAGSINFESTVEYKAERIGKDSTISEIVRMVVEATNTKAPISKLADKICSYFVPIVIVLATLTLIFNLILGSGIESSLTRFVTVLVVACPCSLGLATPLALVVSVGTSARRGILIKNSKILEVASHIDTVVFDKTGTLTIGKLSIEKIINHSNYTEKELIEMIGSIEKTSTHPLAKGIMQYVKDNKIKANMDMITEDLPGYGVKAKEDKNTYYACNRKLLEKLEIINPYKQEEDELATNGNSVIYLVKNQKILAIFGLRDIVRKEAKKTVQSLHKRNINVIMLSGDNEKTAIERANELGIKNVIAETTPKDKKKHIEDLINKGNKVMMVGDGINDAPSLTTADIGITLSSGTDIASNSSDVVLISNNLLRIVELLDISKKTIRNIKQNLFWAFLYNICMIPLAMGLIKTIQINPMIACIAMIISSLTVTLNALRLRKIK